MRSRLSHHGTSLLESVVIFVHWGLWNGLPGTGAVRMCGALSVSSPGLFLERDMWRKKLWEAVPGSWWDWKFCLRLRNFDFLFGPALVHPAPLPPTYLTLTHPLPPLLRIRFLICKTRGLH